MGKGIVKRKAYFTRDNWPERVSPAFAAYWSARKALDLIAWSKEGELKERYDKAWEQLCDASRAVPDEIVKLPEPVSPRVWKVIYAQLDGFETELKGTEPGMTYAVNPESSVFFRLIAFLKFGVTFRRLITAVEFEGSSAAYIKLQKVHYDLFRLKYRKVVFKDLKLKFSLDHFSLMVQGLDLGLNTLNPIELARCFDKLCPCGKRHSVEYMRKFRTRVRRAIKDLLSDETRTYKPVG